MNAKDTTTRNLSIDSHVIKYGKLNRLYKNMLGIKLNKMLKSLIAVAFASSF
jgi:hypothetical protein